MEILDNNGIKIYPCREGEAIGIYDRSNDFEMKFLVDFIEEMAEAIREMGKDRRRGNVETQNSHDWIFNNRHDLYDNDVFYGNWIIRQRCDMIADMVEEYGLINGLNKFHKSKDDILNELDTYSLNKLLVLISRIERKKGGTNA